MINWRHNLIIKIIGVIISLGLFIHIILLIIFPIGFILMYIMGLEIIIYIPFMVLQGIMFILRFRSLDKMDKVFLIITFSPPTITILMISILGLNDALNILH